MIRRYYVGATVDLSAIRASVSGALNFIGNTSLQGFEVEDTEAEQLDSIMAEYGYQLSDPPKGGLGLPLFFGATILAVAQPSRLLLGGPTVPAQMNAVGLPWLQNARFTAVAIESTSPPMGGDVEYSLVVNGNPSKLKVIQPDGVTSVFSAGSAEVLAFDVLHFEANPLSPLINSPENVLVNLLYEVIP